MPVLPLSDFPFVANESRLRPLADDIVSSARGQVPADQGPLAREAQTPTFPGEPPTDPTVPPPKPPDRDPDDDEAPETPPTEPPPIPVIDPPPGQKKPPLVV